jgi:hypothetical protein
MDLQPLWTAANTEEMEVRGYYIRADGPDWIRDRLDVFAAVMPPAVDDLDAEGRDGTGLKTEVPWYRLFSRSRSPRARFGFYVVYLFDRPGERVFASLNQGTTKWVGGDFVPLPESLLAARVAWARSVLDRAAVSTVRLLTEIDLQAAGPLGAGYELGNIYSLVYERSALPDESVFERDLVRLAELLGIVYAAQDSEEVPGELPSEIADVEESAAEAAGRSNAPRIGFRPNAAQRRAIERRAMDAATEYLASAGWEVENVSRDHSYDLLATLDTSELHVEVKGTTSKGEVVLLTRREVEHHQTAAPNSALIVVSDIRLSGTPQAPSAEGGDLRVIEPWKIAPESLTPIAYQHVVPEAD